jgi:hypothetical protein
MCKVQNVLLPVSSSPGGHHKKKLSCNVESETIKSKYFGMWEEEREKTRWRRFRRNLN